MKAFAYPNSDPLREFGLLELKEIIFFANSKTLNAVAQFLVGAAIEMDRIGEACDQVITMKAYAYPISDPLQKNKPLELNEVTLSADSKAIRFVAQHLIRATSDMDRLGEAYDHVHMCGNSPAWEEQWPDIIVCKPQNEKPKQSR